MLVASIITASVWTTSISMCIQPVVPKSSPGKAKPFTPEQWPEMVVNAFQILSDNYWVPCATLIIGLPSEKDEDVQLTINLVKKLHDYKSLLVPLFMVNEGGLKDKVQSFKLENITQKQSEFSSLAGSTILTGQRLS